MRAQRRQLPHRRDDSARPALAWRRFEHGHLAHRSVSTRRTILFCIEANIVYSHKYTRAVHFEYYNGCNGQGNTCASANCHDAFHTPTDYWAQVQCQVNGVSRLYDLLFGVRSRCLLRRSTSTSPSAPEQNNPDLQLLNRTTSENVSRCSAIIKRTNV